MSEVMVIPNLAEGGSSRSPFHPRVAKLGEPMRDKTGGSTFLWTLTLQWDLTGFAIGSVKLPAPFDKAREAILRAATSKDQPPYHADIRPRTPGTCRIIAAVDGTELDLGLNDLQARVDKVAVAAKSDLVQVFQLVRVVTSAAQAAAIVQLRDHEVRVTMAVQPELAGLVPKKPATQTSLGEATPLEQEGKEDEDTGDEAELPDVA